MDDLRIISVIDTSIASYNIGNQIIMDAVYDVLDELFPSEHLINLPAEDIKTNARKYNSQSLFTVVGGTNLLNRDIRKYRQLDLCLHNILILKRLVLLGCGWFQYEDEPITRYSEWAYKKILSDKFIHSVRDGYTQRKLESIGIASINTGCPTLWALSDNSISKIPLQKASKVVCAITDYNQKPERDYTLLDMLLKSYEDVYIFPQGTGDFGYLKQYHNFHLLKFLPSKLDAYNKFLNDENTDYVGTRLHAGIRALQKHKRSFIVGIDNRSLEMAHDFGLPVISEDRVGNIGEITTLPYSISLNIPFDNIQKWKDQFKSL